MSMIRLALVACKSLAFHSLLLDGIALFLATLHPRILHNNVIRRCTMHSGHHTLCHLYCRCILLQVHSFQHPYSHSSIVWQQTPTHSPEILSIQSLHFWHPQREHILPHVFLSAAPQSQGIGPSGFSSYLMVHPLQLSRPDGREWLQAENTVP